MARLADRGEQGPEAVESGAGKTVTGAERGQEGGEEEREDDDGGPPAGEAEQQRQAARPAVRPDTQKPGPAGSPVEDGEQEEYRAQAELARPPHGVHRSQPVVVQD